MLLNFTVLDILLGSLVVYLLNNLVRSPSKPFPPGPKGVPLLGNALDMPKDQAWKIFDSWSRTYGDIIGLNVLGQRMVILNSTKHAYEMLEKRSVIYSDRPVLTMACTLVGWQNTLALTPYNSRFRELRRLLFNFMGTKNSANMFTEVQELETHRFLRRVLDQPSQLPRAIRKTAGAIILSMSHGYQVLEDGDPIVACVDKATEQFSEATKPGAFLVDVLPALRYVPAWFPGAGFQRQATEWASTLREMADIPHNFVKTQMAAGKAMPSFTSLYIEQDQGSNEEVVKWAAASLYSGGADTTVSVIYSFYLAMTLYPSVQKAAQAELDALVGNERLPNLKDRKKLPFLEAVVKEVFRWMPVAPLGLPHRVSEDNIYEGYLIPKGTLVITNQWKFLHDSTRYRSPMEFKPERFLVREGFVPEEDPKMFCFGSGRRSCPGQILADTSVWLSVACSLAVFDISKAKDLHGQDITPVPEQLSGTISHPKPFECSIKPRSAAAVALIKAVDFGTA